MLFSIWGRISRPRINVAAGHRKGAVAVAALAALAGARAAHAEAPSPLSLQHPVYLQEETPARTPAMALLDRVGLAQPLEEAGITFAGRVEASYTYGLSKPPG